MIEHERAGFLDVRVLVDGFTIWLERVFGVALVRFGVRLLSAKQ